MSGTGEMSTLAWTDAVQAAVLSRVPADWTLDIEWYRFVFPQSADMGLVQRLASPAAGANGADGSLAPEAGGMILFPTVRTVLPALIGGFVLSWLRVVLTVVVFRSFAEWCILPSGQAHGPMPPRNRIGMLELDPEFASLLGDVGRKKKKTSAIQPKAKRAKADFARIVQRVKEGSRGKHLLSVREVEEYLEVMSKCKLHRLKVNKFVESLWRFIFYTAAFVYGLYVLLHKDWFLDTPRYWENYPYNPVPSDVWFYYMCGLAVYIHQLMFQFTDLQQEDRSDFWEMFIHHCTTISLIVFSYLASYVRVGCAIMLVHDAADIFLEFAKLFNYSADNHEWCRKVSDACFVIFASVFAITRLYIFPRYLLYTTLVEAAEILVEHSTAFYAFNTMLVILQCLHIFWMYLILSMAVGMAKEGTVKADIREHEYDEQPSTASTEGARTAPDSKKRA